MSPAVFTVEVYMGSQAAGLAAVLSPTQHSRVEVARHTFTTINDARWFSRQVCDIPGVLHTRIIRPGGQGLPAEAGKEPSAGTRRP